MSRKGKIEKRDVLPDPIYNSKLVTRLINRVMYDGKRGTAQTISYNSFKIIEEKTQKPAIDVFATAINKYPIFIWHFYYSRWLICIVRVIYITYRDSMPCYQCCSR